MEENYLYKRQYLAYYFSRLNHGCWTIENTSADSGTSRTCDGRRVFHCN